MLDLILILINLKLESFLKKYLAPAVRHKLLALWDKLNLFPFDYLLQVLWQTELLAGNSH